MDFIGSQERTNFVIWYILLLAEYNTQFALAVTVPHTSDDMVGIIVVKELLYEFQLPDVFRSDKASYWINEMVKNASDLQKDILKHLDSGEDQRYHHAHVKEDADLMR